MAEIGIKDVSGETPWLVEQLRLTAFPAPGGPGTALARDWWVGTTGQPPERVQEEPRKGSIQLQGMDDDGQLVMRVDAERLDIRKLFRWPPDVSSSVREYSKDRGAFAELAARWLELDNVPTDSEARIRGYCCEHTVE